MISYDIGDNLNLMDIIKGIERFNLDYFTATTIGNFDGVHIGHSRIIEKVVSLSKEYNLRSVVITFDPHPVRFFGQEIQLLTDLEKKNEILGEMGVDYHLIMDFNKDLMTMDPEVFVREILTKKLKTRFLVVGYDYKFGARRKGDFELLKLLSTKYGYTAFKYDKVVIDGLTVSSSNIRRLLQEGNLKLSNKMLGRFYSVVGKVAKGDGIGRLLGYPTTNIKLKDFLIPKNGIYATFLKVAGIMHKSVTNVGIRPTIPGKNELRVETYIFDFQKDIYDEKVELYFVEYIREEKRFDNFEDLKKQIAEDCIKAKNILGCI